MKTLKLGKHIIEQYDSIEELPMSRYQKFSKFLLVDAGVGSDAEHFMEHANRIASFIRVGDKESALKEVENMAQCVQLIISDVSPAFMAFLALIKSVDGEEVQDLTEEGLSKLRSKVDDLPAGLMFGRLAEAKKKLESELRLYFPSLFDSSDEKEYFLLLKRKALVIADQLKRKDLRYHAEELKELDDRMVSFSKPMSFSGSESAEIKSDRQYHDGCLVISSQTGMDPYNLTVLEYYNALGFIQARQKERRKNGKRKR
ncbi:MAG: hypothetical protein IKX02_01965 [Spirochaetales bacterium]|nr:hypothetical protein [Spirochaetales bacterium]